MSTTSEPVELVGDEIVGNLARAALFAALTGVFAYVSFQLPVSSVPFTLQVLGVFLAGAFLGPVWGFASLAIYVVAGAVGVPVYAYGASGLAPLFSQWGGYLWSYPLAAAIVGYAAHGTNGLRDLDDISLRSLVAGMVVATVVIYAFGTAFFAYVGNVGLVEAATVTALPFIPAELLKMGATIAAVRADDITAA